MFFTCSYDTSSSDGFFVLFSSVVIVESNHFGFGPRHSIENRFVEGPAWVQHGCGEILATFRSDYEYQISGGGGTGGFKPPASRTL